METVIFSIITVNRENKNGANSWDETTINLFRTVAITLPFNGPREAGASPISKLVSTHHRPEVTRGWQLIRADQTLDSSVKPVPESYSTTRSDRREPIEATTSILPAEKNKTKQNILKNKIFVKIKEKIE